MKVFPAVDILGGRCVQLVQGKKDCRTEYGAPLDCAKRWIDEGADRLHIVNLDGAFGSAGSNAELIRELVRETGAYVQLGGGIRSVEDASGWLDTGVDRVILGTLATEHPEAVTEVSDLFGKERVVAGVDARGGQVVVKGWENSAGDYIEWAKRFEEAGAGALLFTNVDVEGLQKGIDPVPVERLVKATSLPVIVAGGISSPEDVVKIKKIGADGIVLGSALYSGRISLGAAMEVSK
ncbi:phosphoribosylformimino-5-aminoimidazole carboxamide ribotide isomerase [Methanolacinia petrolearia DSM 11571]|uniref:1-(5-phosphoribosyl)-5-[(5-phosphoribosylamino)methylideneamino] imidazole-4-carboxamide isomerase n=1 Tax=Methanolacinia petrolearia (strain DSM 11571 / OCM 486 / SEBR 4847) TaxID=679926 RepID=E1RKS2_METP4|nr:1-(5-phosphoribosyl)-5-[(5-phosphoribosylamino)methylideneamino]imidazole-4-carboxamide isomerase [Methanolacinia petrolearia]ADN37011.1 phosphoribosylformimino-5-aminoimidazole carboxamide ribotide isomerase [Methanolacinia petrolearia DSM 11571]